MEKIEPGKYFEFAYKLFRVNADGSETLVHEVVEEDPDRAIMGLTPGFVPELEEKLMGLKPGDKFDFVADPENAFGPYDPEEVISLPKDRFLIDGKFDEEMFTPGALIPLKTADGYLIDGTVVELTPDQVVLDFNHPLAKDKVHYIGEVTVVRQPTQEELQPAHCGCEGGCGCCHDGACDDTTSDCGCHKDDSCGCGCH